MNERMAAALAPVLGEAAVYKTVWRCAEGHSMGPTTGWTPPGTSYCTEVVSAPGEKVRVCAGTAAYVASEPVDFADPAVGWGVLERYLKATSSYLTLDHNTERSVFEAHVFPDLAYQFVHEGYADTAWGSVLMAWAQALGVSGDD